MIRVGICLKRVAELVLLLAMLALNLRHANADTCNIPFSAANYSKFDFRFQNSTPLLANQRSFTFNPHPDFQTNTPSYDPTWGGGGYGSMELTWPANRTNFFEVTNIGCDSNQDVAYGYAGVTTYVDIRVGEFGSSLSDALTNSFYGLPTDRIFDTRIKYIVKGGVGDGRMLYLNGKWAYYLETSGDNMPVGDCGDYPTNYSYGADATILLAVDLGIEPHGFPEMLLITWSIYADLELGVRPNDTSLLSFGAISSQLLSTPDPTNYIQNVVNYYQSQITGQSLVLSGAPPEFLLLYDFSSSNSVVPSAIVPSSVVTTRPPGLLNSMYPYINQYDAGVAFTLPKRFKNPNPSPVYTPGGNACGPTSLGMALHALNASGDAHSIYDNTMQYGWVSTDDFANSFQWAKAKAWLEGAPDYEKEEFSSPSPLPSGTSVYLLSDTQSNRIASDWTNIDGVLTGLKQPILFRTDLGLGSGLTPNTIGGGHVILLLGKSHSDFVGNFYGLSGDYYIVADPAGHFFANITGTHYGLMTNLMAQCVGISYGGWCAIYPKELLQESILDKNNAFKPRLAALTFPSPFAYQQTQVQSPAALIVTDSLGRQTGIQTDGTVIENIPQSWYQPDVADEEEDGSTIIVPNGSKTVVINKPPQGLYQIQLTGTGNGSFQLGWVDVTAQGGQFSRTTVTNAIATGQTSVYQFMEGTMPPRLGISITNNTVVIFWPTNASGFSLQKSTSLSTQASWSSGPSPTIVGTNYTVTNALSAATMFYRLKM